MKRAISILVMMVALLGSAQESQTIKLQFDQSKISPLFTMPELPTAISPATNIRPTFEAQFPNATELQLNERITMADSLAVKGKPCQILRPKTGGHGFGVSIEKMEGKECAVWPEEFLKWLRKPM